MALLLHDIGKGRDEDHSVLGAQDRAQGGAAAGTEDRPKAETVEWLVRLSPADVGHGAEARSFPIRAR